MNIWHAASVGFLVLSILAGYRAVHIRQESDMKGLKDLILPLLERNPNSLTNEEIEQVRGHWADAFEESKPDLVLDYQEREIDAKRDLRQKTALADRIYGAFVSTISDIAQEYTDESMELDFPPFGGLPADHWRATITFTDRERQEIYVFLARTQQGEFPQLRFRVTSGESSTYLYLKPDFDSKGIMLEVVGSAPHHLPTVPASVDFSDESGIRDLARSVMQYQLARVAAADQ